LSTNRIGEEGKGINTTKQSNQQKREMADQVNQVDVQALIERIRSNDAELVKVNLNSHQALKAGTEGEYEDAAPDTAIAIAGALESNDKVLDLQMARCHVNNDGAKALAHMLEVNKTLQNLNLETNDIGGEGILALIQSLKNNETLTELKLTNQLKPIPSDIGKNFFFFEKMKELPS